MVDVGASFGRLTVVDFVGVDARSNKLWECRCDCGAHVTVAAARLRDKQRPTVQCPACRRRQQGRSVTKDMIGCRSGLLVVVADAGERRGGQAMWLCRCDCGRETVVRGREIRRGKSKSCGCATSSMISAARRTHGGSHGGSLAYQSWASMRLRCRDPKQKCWKDYGGRGIRVCDRWERSFELFLEDMGERPSLAHSIDRFPNPNGNYEPGNCRWATREEQGSNKRLSAARVAAVLDDMSAASSDSVERAVLARVRRELLGG